MLLGSHVGMSGKEMFLGSVKEALSYGANTFMVYTGAPQNTRRKKVSELRSPEGQALMKEQAKLMEIRAHRRILIPQKAKKIRNPPTRRPTEMQFSQKQGV